MLDRRGVAAAVDVSVAQQELAESLPGAHQVLARVLAGSNEVTGLFLLQGRDVDGHDLVQAQHLAEVPGVAHVGLDPVPAWTLELRGCCDLTPDPDTGEVTRQAVAGRAGLVGHRPRTRQLSDPAGDDLVVRDQPRFGDLARNRVEGRSDHRPCMHIQTNTRTLYEHRGLPRM